MRDLKQCPICHADPKIGYSCGDYFMHCSDGCPSPMCDHSVEETTVCSWNDWTDWYERNHSAAPEEDEPSKEELITALDKMAEYLGECVECPAAATGRSLWPECNGEAETCGDNRTVGGCWKQYFLEKARAQNRDG